MHSHSCRAHQTTWPVICYCSSLAWFSVFCLDVAQPAGQPDGGPGGRAVVHYGNCGNAWLVYIVWFCFRAVLQSSNITSVTSFVFSPLHRSHVWSRDYRVVADRVVTLKTKQCVASPCICVVILTLLLQRRADCEVLEAAQDNCCRTYLLEDSAPRGCRVMTLTDANVVQR